MSECSSVSLFSAQTRAILRDAIVNLYRIGTNLFG
jgi:hypothetical protein